MSVRLDEPLVRLFLVDEHEVVRRGVRKVMEADPGITVAGEAGSLAEALRRVPAVRPDVAVVAARWAGGNGASVCAQLRALVPGLRCLVLADDRSSGTMLAAKRAGASGYVDKRAPGAVLLSAVRRVASGGTAFDGPEVTPSGRRVDDELLESLTYRERAVLDLLGEGLSNREIGERLRLAPKTVKNYVTSLLAKLALQNRTQAAVLVTRIRSLDTTASRLPGPRLPEPDAPATLAREPQAP